MHALNTFRSFRTPKSTYTVSRTAHFWLRHETKKNEHRTPILASQIKLFQERGHTVTVEKSPTRCIDDQEYAEAGCELVESGSWTGAPKDAIILGLKELPESDAPIEHHHIYFAHCYKDQDGWESILQRFQKGNGKIWDLEFLTFEDGRRVAAFGKSAGYAGMAVGVQAWAHNIVNEPLKKLYPKTDFETLAKYSATVAEERVDDSKPSVLVIGSKGRCGNGAISAAVDIGIPEENIGAWDIEETSRGGPFKEILDYDILVNCIYLKEKTAPFLDWESVESAKNKKLSVIVDVSCDYNNPANPLPVYHQSTSFDEPTLQVDHSMKVVAIDHLPTLVPNSSSEEFSSQLLPHLLEFNETSVWERAGVLFENMVKRVK